MLHVGLASSMCRAGSTPMGCLAAWLSAGFSYWGWVHGVVGVIAVLMEGPCWAGGSLLSRHGRVVGCGAYHVCLIGSGCLELVLPRLGWGWG